MKIMLHPFCLKTKPHTDGTCLKAKTTEFEQNGREKYKFYLFDFVGIHTETICTTFQYRNANQAGM